MFMSSYKNMLEYVQFVFGDVSYMIKLCCLLGQYLKSRGNAQEALEVYEEAVRLAQKLENKDEEVSLYIDMNNIHLESINASDARNIL
jgi:tetratricopeptide (TPR) repeat protein